MGIGVIDIRPFLPEDLEAAVALEAANQPSPWSVTVFRDELAAKNRIYVVADADGLVGFGGTMIVGEEAHVTNLLVDRNHRRDGIGTRLLTALIEGAVEGGARHLTLEVRSRNGEARALYARFGLAPVGVRKRYYGDDDALIMWAHDIDDPSFLEGLR